MEPTPEADSPKQTPAARDAEIQRPEVIIVRNWKEYVGESLLIVFSVMLALGLSEYIGWRHETHQTREIVRNLRLELAANLASEKEQYQYDLQILQNIDKILADDALLARVVDKGEFHLDQIAPEGILNRYLNEVAWEVAKSHDIASKIDLKTTLLLTRIYDDQSRIMRVEDEVAKIILSHESRRRENVRETLILIRDNYHGWAVDRTPVLLQRYAEATSALAWSD